VSRNGKGRLAGGLIENAGEPPPEAAAEVASVEQILAENAPAPEPAPATNPWQRAALVEGVSAKQAFGPERRIAWRS
jgi:hypothetical protein